MIKAGALDQRIGIEVPTNTTNALGEQVPAWTQEAEVWARAIETPGREFLKGDYQASEKVAFQIRYRPMDSTARVTWRGRTWRVDSVTGTMREGATWLHCTATDGAN